MIENLLNYIVNTCATFPDISKIYKYLQICSEKNP